jgi:hypothetical protein
MPTQTPASRKKALVKEARRLAACTETQRQARTDELSELAAPSLAWELQRFGIDETEDTDRGILLVMLMKVLGLGIPAESEWSIEGVKFLMRNVFGKTYTRAQMATKAVAFTTLRKIMTETDGSGSGSDEEPPEVERQLPFPTPKPKPPRKRKRKGKPAKRT